MKKLITCLTTLLILFASTVYGSSNIAVTLNGEQISFADGFILEEGTSFLPIREMAEILGFTVTWNGITKEIGLTYKDFTTELSTEDYAHQWKNNRIYISTRQLAEALSMQLTWNQSARLIELSWSEDQMVKREASFEVVSSTQVPKDVIDRIHQVKKTPGAYLINAENGDMYGVITAGPQPNPGYKLQYLRAEVEGKELIVHVRIVPPDPVMMYPQVISYPYIVGKVSSEVESIRAVGIKSDKEIK